MIRSINKRGKTKEVTDVLLAFVQSWNLHGRDEVSISSGAVDVLRAYLGERPCCVWKKVNSGLTKVCERGMVDLLLSGEEGNNQSALTKTMVSGLSEFEKCKDGVMAVDSKDNCDGFLNVPIKDQEEVSGILSVAVTNKEARDRDFVQTMECLGRLIAIAINQSLENQNSSTQERKLRAEIEATSRELTQTNARLIERVKELKTMSRELEKRVEELTHANRAKDEFLSIVSHELRTPLTSLKGFLCIILDGEAGSITDPQRKFLNIAKQSADRLNVLISDLLDVSRIESGRMNLQMEECVLLEIIQTSVEGQQKSAATKNINLSLETNLTKSKVWGDASRLQQVIDNIISNAIKFTPFDGKITVQAQEDKEGIAVSISDTGPGISNEEKIKIFDLFYQVDASSRRKTGGAGLGLAIANGIVTMHGGKIEVSSEMGKGTTFTFVIPRYKEQKAA